YSTSAGPGLFSQPRQQRPRTRTPLLGLPKSHRPNCNGQPSEPELQLPAASAYLHPVCSARAVCPSASRTSPRYFSCPTRPPLSALPAGLQTDSDRLRIPLQHRIGHRLGRAGISATNELNCFTSASAMNFDFFLKVNQFRVSFGQYAAAEDFIDVLNYMITPTILIFFAGISATKQYLFTPIQCWTLKETEGSQRMEYIENLCWIEN
uniref:Innexin n=1 Tax=Macrostomum lignano TaxID=282301 RepID=A0A1I8JB22_9PLAT